MKSFCNTLIKEVAYNTEQKISIHDLNALCAVLHKK